MSGFLTSMFCTTKIQDTRFFKLQHFTTAWSYYFTLHSDNLSDAFAILVQALTNIMHPLLESPAMTPMNSSIITYPFCRAPTSSIMEGTTYVTHTHTVCLKANKPPSFPQSVRHWNISSTHGILPSVDPQENATYLGTLPGRIVTVPMLNRAYYHQIMTVLLLI